MWGMKTIPTGREAGPPRWGPDFLPLGAWEYRLEYAVATVAILVAIFGWRMAVLRELPVTDLIAFVLWFLLPDIIAFVPIGLSRRKKGGWPQWGSLLYNLMHSLLTWVGVFFVAWVLTGGIPWPLLGWAAHITLDRAAGYHLRSRSDPATASTG